MGFASGFARGWSNEMDRQERRKEFQAALQEKRFATLAEVIARRNAAGLGSVSGGSGGEGGDGGTGGSVDANHYTSVLTNYGMSTDNVAELAAKGPYALKAAVEVIEKNPDAIWTPETFSKLPGAIVVTQQETGSVDVAEITNRLYGPEYLSTLDPIQRELLDLEATPAPQAPLVSNTYRTVEPPTAEVINQTIAAADDTLIAELVARREEADARVSAATDAGDVETAAKAAEESRTFDGLITEVEKGNVAPAIEAVGSEVIGAYLENNPQLKTNPQVLGKWKFAAEAYLNPPAQEAEAAPQQTPQGNNFATKEEALRAIKSGQIPSGGTFYINGQGPYENDL